MVDVGDSGKHSRTVLAGNCISEIFPDISKFFINAINRRVLIRNTFFLGRKQTICKMLSRKVGRLLLQ